MRIAVKRVYDAVSEGDGLRILVDRLWPRGLSKEKARIDRWLPDLAPSADLRRWFNHETTRWNQFKRRYFDELDARFSLIATIRAEATRNSITLIFAAKDKDFNNATALRDYLLQSRKVSGLIEVETPLEGILQI